MRKKNQLNDSERMLENHDRISVAILYSCFVLLCIVGYLLLTQIR